jgi:hypothetical protein
LGGLAPCVTGSAQLSLVLVIVAKIVSGIGIYFLLASHQSHHKEDKSNYEQSY